MTLKNGKSIEFWTDKWIGNDTLKNKFPRIYKISRTKKATVRDMMNEDGAWNIKFRRALNEKEMGDIADLLQVLGVVTEISDEIIEDCGNGSLGRTFQLPIATLLLTLMDCWSSHIRRYGTQEYL